MSRRLSSRASRRLRLASSSRSTSCDHRREQHRMAGFDQRASQCRHDVGFAGAGSADQADVGRTGEELAAQELSDLPAQRRGVAVQVERCEGFLASAASHRAATASCADPRGRRLPERDQLGEISHVAPAFSCGALGQLEVVLEERGKPQRL